MRRALLAVLCLLFIFAAPVQAAPSLSGSTGLINTPTADVLRQDQIELGYYHLNGGDCGVFGLNIADRLELGVAGFRFDERGKNNTFVNAKYSLVPEGILIPGVAVGVEDIGDRAERAEYIAVSKGLPFGFRLHAGAGSGRYGGMFAGIEKTLNPVSVISGNNTFPATTLIAEYDGHYMNYCARVSLIPGLKFDAGWREHESYFGLTFTN
jgi:hypothetical protein